MVDYSTGRGHYRPKPLIDIMSYKYNVFTGKLDYYESGSSETLTLVEQGATPSDPTEGKSIMWQAANGDILIKITESGSTKTATLVPFSLIS